MHDVKFRYRGQMGLRRKRSTDKRGPDAAALSGATLDVRFQEGGLVGLIHSLLDGAVLGDRLGPATRFQIIGVSRGHK